MQIEEKYSLLYCYIVAWGIEREYIHTLELISQAVDRSGRPAGVTGDRGPLDDQLATTVARDVATINTRLGTILLSNSSGGQYSGVGWWFHLSFSFSVLKCCFPQPKLFPCFCFLIFETVSVDTFIYSHSNFK